MLVLSESDQKVLNITGGRRWLQMSTNIAVEPSPTAENEFLDQNCSLVRLCKATGINSVFAFFGFQGVVMFEASPRCSLICSGIEVDDSRDARLHNTVR